MLGNFKMYLQKCMSQKKIIMEILKYLNLDAIKIRIKNSRKEFLEENAQFSEIRRQKEEQNQRQRKQGEVVINRN